MSDEQAELQQQPVEQAQTQVTTEPSVEPQVEQPTEQTGQAQTADAPKKTLTQEEVDKLVANRLAREKSEKEKLEFEHFKLQQQLQQMQQQQGQYQQQEGANQGQPAQQANNQAAFDPMIMQVQAKAYQSEAAMRQKAQDYDAVVSNPWLQHGLTYDKAFLTAVSRMDDPAAFAYEAAKNHSDRLQKIVSNPDAFTRLKELISLEAELKHKAQAPKVSQAPAPMKEEKGETYAPAASPDAIMEERRKARGR